MTQYDSSREYRFLIDLDGNGVAEYDATDDLMSLAWGLGRDNELDPVGIKQLNVGLYSEDGKYQIDRAQSSTFDATGDPGHQYALGGQLGRQGFQVGRKVTLEIRSEGFGNANAWIPAFSGTIAEITNDFESEPVEDKHITQISCDDDSGLLGDQDIAITVQKGVRFSEMVDLVLDKVKWQGSRSISRTKRTSWAWWSKGSAQSALQAIQDAERGVFYVGSDGGAVYQDRHYRFANARATTPQLTLFGDFTTLTQFARLSDVRTMVEIRVTPYRLAKDETVIWEYDFEAVDGNDNARSPIVIAPGRVKSVDVSYSGGPAYAVKFESGEFGDWVVVDASGTQQPDNASVVFDEGPDGGRISIRNTGSFKLYVVKLQVRGKSLESQPEITSEESLRPKIVGDYWKLGVSKLGTETRLGGARRLEFRVNEWNLSPSMLVDERVAKDMTKGLLDRYGKQLRQIAVTIDNVQDSLLATILQMKLSDRVRINLGLIDMYDDFWLEGVEHSVSADETDWLHSVTMHLTLCTDQTFWVLDQSKLDISTRLGW